MYAAAPDRRLLEALIGRQAQSLSRVALSVLLELSQLELSGLGISGPAQRRILACAELARRYQPAASQPETVSTAQQAVAHLSGIRRLDREALTLLMLDAQLHPLGVEIIAHGGLAKIAVSPVDVFRPAVRTGASAVVIAHNHPSGSVDPSPEDLAFTKAMVAAGATLHIEVVDHIIVGLRSFRSLREARLLE